MTLRPLIALTVVAGTLVLAGWAATSFVGWEPGQSLAGGAPARAAPPQAPAVAEAVKVEPPEAVNAAPPRSAWNPIFFSPHTMIPRQPLAPEARETTGAVRPESEVTPPMPPARPRQAALPRPSQRPTVTSGSLNAEQIAKIKRRLRLTADQEQYWPPIEAALLAVAREQAQGRTLETISAEVSQNLYFAAGPLIMRLREDQKAEARSLAREMGLAKVASLI